MSSELENIELMYTRILRIVYKGIGDIEDKETLGLNDVKFLETYDKIVRNSLDIYGKKKPKDKYTEKTIEELEAELEGEEE